MVKKKIKPEIRIRQIMGGLHETAKTGEYPDYHLLRSRKFSKTWKFKNTPVELKYKGEVVYSVADEVTIYDKEGRLIDDVEFIMEMRD